MSLWRYVVAGTFIAALAIALVLVLIRSNGTTNAAPPDATPSPTAVSPRPSPSPTDHDPMPVLENTGEDFDRIIRSIEEFRSWLYRHPDPELVDRIYHPDCECYEGVKERLETLIADEVRFDVNETIIHEVSVLDRDPDVVALKVVDEGVPQVVVDSSTGEVVETGHGWQPRAYRFLLFRQDGRWLMRDITSVPLDLEVPSASGV